MSDYIHPLCQGCNTRHAKNVPCPDGTIWFVWVYRCRICGDTKFHMIPISPDEIPVDLECGKCHKFTCDPLEPEEVEELCEEN